jgi:hypothetical protein
MATTKENDMKSDYAECPIAKKYRFGLAIERGIYEDEPNGIMKCKIDRKLTNARYRAKSNVSVKCMYDASWLQPVVFEGP